MAALRCDECPRNMRADCLVENVCTQLAQTNLAVPSLGICLTHVAQGWRRAPSPHSWGNLGATSKCIYRRVDHKAHVVAIHRAWAHDKLAANLEPVAVAAVAAHAKVVIGADVRQWRVDAAAAEGARELDCLANVSQMSFQKVLAGGIATVRACLQTGVPLVNARDRWNRTLLDWASEAGDTDVVQLLLENSADACLLKPDRNHDDKNVPICLAAQKGNIEVLGILARICLSEDLIVDHPVDNSADALSIINIDVVRDANDGAGFSIDSRTMGIAKISPNRKEALLPMKLGDQITAVNGTPVENMEEFRNQARDVANFTVSLVAYTRSVQADRSASYGRGLERAYMALNIACEQGHVQAIQCLLDARCNIDAKSPGAKTPLMAAAFSGRYEATRLLIERGASIKQATSTDGYTALHQASAEGRCEIIQELVTSGCSVELRTARGMTPLMLALKSGQDEAVETLLLFSADINAVDNLKRTPLDLAVIMEREVSIRRLLHGGAEMTELGLKSLAKCAHEAVRNTIEDFMRETGQEEIRQRIHRDRVAVTWDFVS